jgi:hypothetical protein
MAPVKVFISYAREDRSFAERIYNSLKDLQIDPWLDTRSITPGMRWKDEITRGLRAADYCIILLSDHSVSKRGFCQSEILDALEILKQFPRDRAFIIPVRINECTPHDLQLQDLQDIDLFPNYEHGLFTLIEYFRQMSPDYTPISINTSALPEFVPVKSTVFSPYLSFGDFARFMFSQFPKECLANANAVAFVFTVDAKNSQLQVPDYVKSRFPEEIRLVVQHQYANFLADHEKLSVTLWFSNKPENIVIPYDSIKTIWSPQLGLEIRQHSQATLSH